METVIDFILGGSKITADGDCSRETERCFLLGRKVLTNLDSILKSRDITLTTKVRLVKAMVFPVAMYGLWELDREESWRPKNWCFWTMVLEKTLESPLDCKDIQPVYPKGNQPNIHWKDWCWSWNSNTLATWCEELTPWKRPWCWERLKAGEKGTTGDEMVGWHHWREGHEFEQAPGVDDGQGKPDVLQSMGSQSTGHDWATELNWFSLHYLQCSQFTF